jgi:hypothetical protein
LRLNSPDLSHHLCAVFFAGVLRSQVEAQSAAQFYIALPVLLHLDCHLPVQCTTTGEMIRLGSTIFGLQEEIHRLLMLTDDISARFVQYDPDEQLSHKLLFEHGRVLHVAAPPSAKVSARVALYGDSAANELCRSSLRQYDFVVPGDGFACID